jgi:hypothetical protein
MDKPTARGAGAGESHVTLKIPRPLYQQLKQVIQGSGFHSVTEFAVYVLRDLVSHRGRLQGGASPADAAVARPAPSAPAEDVEPLSPEEIDAIRRRLESLGYL